MTDAQKTISFSVYATPDLPITQGLATVYRMYEDRAEEVATGHSSSANFDLTLRVEDGAYYYVQVLVQQYLLDGRLTAADSGRVILLAVFDSTAGSVVITARSTIAVAYTFARMIHKDLPGNITIYGPQRSLRIAYGMKNNFVSVNGSLSDVISKPPNQLESNSYPMFNSLGNMVYNCIISLSFFNRFISLTNGESGQDATFIRGLVYLIGHPFDNASAIYELIASAAQPLTPALSQLTLPSGYSPVPDHWTLAIKVNDSGAQNFLMSGLAFVVFDKEDKAWITNNFRAGTANSGTHCIVLNPDGSPSDISPITGGGILGPGFGIATDRVKEKIAIGNFGWGVIPNNPQQGSISMFNYDGRAISPPNGFTRELCRAQGMCYDDKGNLWIASMGSQAPMAPTKDLSVYKFANHHSALVCYLDGNPDTVLSFTDFGTPSAYHNTFDVATDKDGNAIVCNIGSAAEGIPSSIYKIGISNNKLVRLASWTSDYYNSRTGETGYEELRQVAVNDRGEIFVVAISSSRVIKFDSDLNQIAEFTTNIYAPWGIVIDKNGTIFVSNFGREKERNGQLPDSLDMQGPFGITVIQNEDDSTAQLLTLPTGGDQVTLRNGFPLYGAQQIQGVQMVCYQPLMRLTSSNIDGAGNLWAMNNWKPSAYVDIADNPGGDGAVIFVGVAEPA